MDFTLCGFRFSQILRISIVTISILQGFADARQDLVFVLDASTGVTKPNFDLMKDFIKDFLYVADIDNGNVRVGGIICSSDHVMFHLNTYQTKADVYNAIDEIPYRLCSANIADALNTIRKTMFTQSNGDREGVSNSVIVLTDGGSDINSRKSMKEAELARAEDIHIYAIGIGLTEPTELDGIASKPVDQTRFLIKEFSELKELRHRLFSSLLCDSTVKGLECNCSDNQIFVDRSTICPRQYFRCQSSTWYRAFCVGGFFNATIGQCVPSYGDCVNIGLENKDLPMPRKRRQAPDEKDCLRSYLCPNDLTQDFIFPDWANTECDTFYQCTKGMLTLGSCKQGVYKYYNPRTFSCEESPAMTNTCLQRQRTDLGPLNK